MAGQWTHISYNSCGQSVGSVSNSDFWSIYDLSGVIKKDRHWNVTEEIRKIKVFQLTHSFYTELNSAVIQWKHGIVY